MQYIFIRNFTGARKEKLDTFLALCRTQDGNLPMLNLPDEPMDCEGCIAAIFKNSGDFAGILTYLQTKDCFELAAIVHPEYRKQGIFTALYREFEKKVLAESSNIPDTIVWPLSDSDTKVARFLSHIGKQESYREFLMTLDLSKYFYLYHNAPFTFFTKRHVKKESTYIYHLYKGLRKIGTCYVSDGCIYNVEIHPTYRRKRFGNKLLIHAINHQRKLGQKRLFLHVTSLNIAACRLYQTLGFELAEQIIYFK